MKKLLLLISIMVWRTVAVWSQPVVDVHSHNILPSYLEFLDRHDALLEEGFPLPSWNVDEHLRLMDEAGIVWSVLTMPAPQPYYGSTIECQKIIRRYNEDTAGIKAKAPERFKFCASLPLPDVDAAIREAIYVLDTLRADGIKLATNSRGQYLGDAVLDPLMEILNERHAVVIIHPHKPVPVNDAIVTVSPLAIYEYPAETTRTVINLIVRNVPARYPHVKFVIPHGGSFLPLAIPRMRGVHPIMQQAGMMGTIDWEANLKSFYYDLAGNISPEVLRSLLTITTPEHLLYGSDFPYVKAEGVKKALAALHKVLMDNLQCSSMADSLLMNNAAELFK